MRRRRAVCVPALLMLLALWPGESAAERHVELLTIGPDRAIDTRFGHVLLRVVDSESKRDDAYDFGVGDFYRPGFMVETVLGRGWFSLRRSPAQVRLGSYWFADREVFSQRLDLTAEQVDELLARLEWNLEPDHVRYLYDHVLDNCSTRLRDLLDHVTGGALREAAARIDVQRTYRDDILEAGSGRLAALIGLDLMAGAGGEASMGAWERSFLPQHLRDLVAQSVNPATGRPLVGAAERLHEREAPSAVGGSTRAGRAVVLGVGGVLGLAFGAIARTARRPRAGGGDRASALGRAAGGLLLLTALVSGGLGAALLPIRALSTATIWTANDNAWLFLPFDLLWAVPAVHWLRTGRPRLGRVMRTYLDVRLLLVAGLLVGGLAGLRVQDNAAFALATGFALLGLRALPAAER